MYFILKCNYSGRVTVSNTDVSKVHYQISCPILISSKVYHTSQMKNVSNTDVAKRSQKCIKSLFQFWPAQKCIKCHKWKTYQILMNQKHQKSSVWNILSSVTQKCIKYTMYTSVILSVRSREFWLSVQVCGCQDTWNKVLVFNIILECEFWQIYGSPKYASKSHIYQQHSSSEIVYGSEKQYNSSCCEGKKRPFGSDRAKNAVIILCETVHIFLSLTFKYSFYTPKLIYFLYP